MLVSHTDHVLHFACTPFNFDNPQTDAKSLAEDLIREKSEKQALGLAANQIGKSLRVFAFMDEVAFNPKVLQGTETSEVMKEGCLSFPGLWVQVERPLLVEVEYQTEDGTVIKRGLNELETRVFLHELDHLNGITMVDLVSDLKLRRAIVKAKKDGYVYNYKELRKPV